MPPYAYPIVIQREKLEIRYEERFRLEKDWITLDDLSFVGSAAFAIVSAQFDQGYEIVVVRFRLETDEEQAKRVAREEAYMEEYRRRHPSK